MEGLGRQWANGIAGWFELTGSRCLEQLRTWELGQALLWQVVFQVLFAQGRQAQTSTDNGASQGCKARVSLGISKRVSGRIQSITKSQRIPHLPCPCLTPDQLPHLFCLTIHYIAFPPGPKEPPYRMGLLSFQNWNCFHLYFPFISGFPLTPRNRTPSFWQELRYPEPRLHTSTCFTHEQ